MRSLCTRYALRQNRNTKAAYFGQHGNDMYFGLRYASDDRQILDPDAAEHKHDPRHRELELPITGGQPSVTTFDAFGNQHDEPIKLTLGRMSIYVRLSADQQATPQQFDFSRNITPAAWISYRGSYEGDLGTLTDGTMENIHHGNLWKSSDGHFV